MGLLSNVLLLSLFNLGEASVVRVSDCSNSKSLFNLTNATFAHAENSTLHLTMFVPRQVNNATATYAVTYGYVPFTPRSEIVCARVACPILPGLLSTNVTYPIPSYLLGTLNVKITWHDASYNELLCVALSVKPGTLSKDVVVYSNYIFPPLMCPYYSNSSYIRAVKKSIKKSVKKLNKTKVKTLLRRNA